MHLHRILSAVAFVCATASLSSMTVRPPSFEQLVAKAETVVRTEVLETRCEERGEGAEKRIVTIVKVRVEKAIVGQAPAEMELRMLGGTLNGMSMHVPGMTGFSKGDRDILFLSGNTRAFCPLVAVNHGRYLLVPKSNGTGDFVARANAAPLHDLAEISQPVEATGPVNMTMAANLAKAELGSDRLAPMDAEVFEARIAECAAALKGSASASQK